MEPKESKMEPKETKMEPKVTNMELQGAKREPKGDQSASKSRLGRQGRFWEPKKECAGVSFWINFGAFLVQKALKINANLDVEKNMKFHEKNILKREPKSMPKLIKNQCQNL